MRSFVLIAALAVAATAGTASRTEAQFVGKWSVEMGEWQTADGGGNVQIQGSNSAVVDLTAKGDSVIASWSGGAGAPTLDLRGKVEGKKLVLKGARQGRVNINGEESTVTLNITVELEAADGGLAGVFKMNRNGEGGVWRSAKAKKQA